eukprot:GFUD01067791.1.p1 GENE.GFUD01067791.1~~GFUD01067791.1.p1  ORF type:complete len:114 (-),score=29.10 GFUD01067791.1:267-608(-)
MNNKQMVSLDMKMGQPAFVFQDVKGGAMDLPTYEDVVGLADVKDNIIFCAIQMKLASGEQNSGVEAGDLPRYEDIVQLKKENGHISSCFTVVDNLAAGDQNTMQTWSWGFTMI